jgi:hypothetical protein
MSEPADIYELLRKIRYDATAIQAKVTDALNALNDLNLPQARQVRCPVAGCELPFRGPNSLAEHVHVSHEGPLPAHWVRADALVGAEMAVVDIDENEETT